MKIQREGRKRKDAANALKCTMQRKAMCHADVADSTGIKQEVDRLNYVPCGRGGLERVPLA
jgi:hypothetical protein